MKKKSHILIIMSIAALLIGGVVKHEMSIRSSLSADIWQNAEVLASGEGPNCYNGGVGASSCSIESGIDVFGLGISKKCEVTCIDGYYACCGLRCICVPYSS